MSTNYTLPASFHSAATYLANAPSLSKVSNSVKLEIYGLYKVLTVSGAPNTGRPGVFDFAGRAKWDAWAEVGKKYTGPGGMGLEMAEQRYEEIAKEHGWDPSTTPHAGGVTVTANVPTQKPESNEDEESLDENWENSTDSSTGSSSGGGGGMAVSVSAMRPPSDDEGEIDNDELHTLVTSPNPDIKKIQEALESTDVNSKDESVELKGYTLLHLASDRGNIEIVRLLLLKGADTSIKDPDDFTPLELAEIAGHNEIVELLKGVDDRS